MGPRPLHSPSAHPVRRALPFACLGIVITLLAFGCGGGSPQSGPTASPTGLRFVPTVSLASPASAVCDQDLTEELADTVIFGAQAGDFLADRFSLASGDFNGDGFADVLVGAPLADGPTDDREDAGQAHIILSR